MPGPLSSAQFERIKTIIATDSLPALDASRRPSAKPASELEAELAVVLGKGIPAHSADLIRGMALLWHDHLETAHALAQQIPTHDGSMLHGIMHRREADYRNAKYWFKRAGKHPCYPIIQGNVQSLLGAGHGWLRKLVRTGGWDPGAFVDLCEEANGDQGPAQSCLMEIQKMEFDALLQSICT